MINSIINFLKSLFIKDIKFRVVDDAGVDIESGKYVGDDIAKALGHMDKDGEWITDPKDDEDSYTDYDVQFEDNFPYIEEKN